MLPSDDDDDVVDAVLTGVSHMVRFGMYGALDSDAALRLGFVANGEPEICSHDSGVLGNFVVRGGDGSNGLGKM